MYCYGVYNLSAGTATFSTNHQQPILGTGNGYGPDYWATGILTVGGTGRLTVSGIILGNSAGGSVGIVNLGAVGSGGGTLSTINLMRGANGGGGTSGGTATVNFHGGALQATVGTGGNDPAGNPNTGLLIGTTNYVYSEGAVIDTNGFNVTIPTALSAPTGNGVTGIAPTAGGSGYIGAPVVKISGGGGVGATAKATIDSATGHVTGIVITNPGTDYTNAPTVTFEGGGGSGATLGTIALTANASGGLTKIGLGTLTLTGTNNYAGMTTVSAGTLDLSAAASLPSGSYVVNGSKLLLGMKSPAVAGLQVVVGTLSGGTVTSSTTYDIQSGTINTVLAGSVGSTKTSAGVATINNPTYTGATSISRGALTFSGALPGGNYAISAGTLSVGTLFKAIGTFQITGGTINGTGTLTSNTAYDVQGGQVSPVLAGGVGLNKTGETTAVLSGANSYSGLTTVSYGTLVFDGGRAERGPLAGRRRVLRPTISAAEAWR